MVRLAICIAWLGATISVAQADTLLHLSDTETVTTAPNELTASLTAQARSGDAADAQQRVNATMANALAEARKVTAVTASTGGYGVWHVGPTDMDSSDHWQASQTLELKSQDSVALLTLVGALQHDGLGVNALDWRLSREAQRKAHDAATHQALAALRGKAEQAADALGLRFGSFKEVRLDAASVPMPVPRFAMAAAMPASPPSAPPNAVATDVPVSATAEADIVLLPK